MTVRPPRILIVSDFNAESLAGYLNTDESAPRASADTVPFGMMMHALTDFATPCWSPPVQAVVIWTQPERVLPSFASVLDFTGAPMQTLIEEVDTWSALIKRVANETRAEVMVPTWSTSPFHRGLGCMDLKHHGGISNVLWRLNLRLVDNLADSSNVHVLNAQRWIEIAGARNAFNPKSWYLGKIAFGNKVYKEAVNDIKATLLGVSGGARKMIVVDLDDTLWGGTVGEVGWEGINLGGHDPSGEAFADFQRALKGLSRRGILLGIVSKNDERTALDAIQQHPEMVLRPDDFAGWRINWLDKAANIESLARALNLGLQSIVYIDDHPVERARVREALPEVLVPEWPEDRLMYREALLSLRCFDSPTLTDEDMLRTQRYVTERKRTETRAAVPSLDEWLATLETRVVVEPLTASNLPRVTQLLNKTNQMNLSVRRMSEAELSAWCAAPQRFLWSFRAADRFGDAGLIGIASLDLSSEPGVITDFLLSCRVIGRKIEETMLHFLISTAQRRGLKEIAARYVATPKNQVCLRFWQEHSGFEAHESNQEFTLQLPTPSVAPDCIELIVKDFAWT